MNRKQCPICEGPLKQIHFGLGHSLPSCTTEGCRLKGAGLTGFDFLRYGTIKKIRNRGHQITDFEPVDDSVPIFTAECAKCKFVCVLDPNMYSGKKISGLQRKCSK